MVDPEKMKQIKKDMKFYSEKSKEARKNNDANKANEYASEMMKLSRKQFGLNFKPMMVSLVIFFLALYTVLGAYGTIMPFFGTYVGGITVNTNDVVNQDTKTGVLQYKDLSYPFQTHEEVYTDENGAERTRFNITIYYSQNNDFSDDEMYNPGDVVEIGDSKWKIYHSDLNQTFFIVAVDLPFTLPLNFGNQVDWIMWYIICAVTFSFIFRKFLGVE